MDQPLFRVLPREEFNKLSLDDRLAYMQRWWRNCAGGWPRPSASSRGRVTAHTTPDSGPPRYEAGGCAGRI